MLRKLTLATVVALILSACGGGSDSSDTQQPADTAPTSFSGTLIREPRAENFDFKYFSDWAFDRAEFDRQGAAVLRANFTWQPPTPAQDGAVIGTPQHVVASFTQGADPRNLRNRDNDIYWEYGVGALLSERGLQLERWFMDNGSSNAFVWSQDNRCQSRVSGTEGNGENCLSSSASDPYYLTGAPDFQLRYGVEYTLRIELAMGQVPSAPAQSTSLTAQLFTQCATSCVLVQQARVGVDLDTWLPQALPIRPSLARTPGSDEDQTVLFTATRQ